MNTESLKSLVRKIVEDASRLKDAHTTERNAPVNYAAIFSHNQEECDELLTVARTIGKVVKETPTGPLFQIDPLDTVAGTLQLLKIRKPDPTRLEHGDADFTVSDYLTFKSTFLVKPGFKLIQRPNMEMIELMDPAFDVRAYFSRPPLDQQLGIVKK